MAAISQTIFSNAYSSMQSFVFWLKFHWNLFLRVQLIIIKLTQFTDAYMMSTSHCYSYEYHDEVTDLNLHVRMNIVFNLHWIHKSSPTERSSFCSVTVTSSIKCCETTKRVFNISIIRTHRRLGHVAVISNYQFSNEYQRKIFWTFPVKLPSGEGQKIWLMISQHWLTHWGWVMHICFRNLIQRWFRWWLVAYLVPSHYLNQYRNTVN